jgi:hypothetical protein
MRVPPHHYSLVGPLWVELEQALLDSGATGSSAEARIRSVEKRLRQQAVRRLHYVRMQRNQLMHAPPRPLDDAHEWERACRQSIRLLQSIARTPRRFGVKVWHRGTSDVGGAPSWSWKLLAICVAATLFVMGGERSIELIATAVAAWWVWTSLNRD